MKENYSVQATIQSVTQGKHGPYAVATSEKIEGSVTFSLIPEVWEEELRPEPGHIVVLSELHKKRGGWRAQKARFLQPYDEEPKDVV